MRYPQRMENGSHWSNGTRDVAQIVRGNRLVDATPETTRELAESAMLLSQGAKRAIKMMGEGDAAGTDRAAFAAPVTVETRLPNPRTPSEPTAGTANSA
jgi:hypothetical protein